jgi:hypothetical protein
MKYKIWLKNGDSVVREADTIDSDDGDILGCAFDRDRVDDKGFFWRQTLWRQTLWAFAAGQWTHFVQETDQ